MSKNIYFKLLTNQITLFTLAFFLMASYLYPLKDLYAASTDAIETWKVVTTFFSTIPFHSYVMYKGFLAFIPNVTFYQLSMLFNLDQFFFVKLFNSLGFAYITAIGIPYFFSFIFRKKIESYKILVLILILYFAIRTNFSFISVDYPSMLVVLLMLNSAIKITTSEKRLPFYYYIYSGLLFGMSSSFSGQYLPAVLCAILFLFFTKVLPLIRSNAIFRIRLLVILACFSIGFSTISISNNYFVKARVQPVREAGEWLPTGGEWLKFALTNNMLFSKYAEYTIPDNRGKAILIKENASIEGIEVGNGTYGFKDYIQLIAKYPIDFLIRWLNRLFLGISIDNTRISVGYLFISYTLLYLALFTLRKRCHVLKDIVNSKTLLILALITPSLVPCLMHVEMRYFMSIQILIVGAALLSDTLWQSIKNFTNCILKKKMHTFNMEIRINYSFLTYIVFITLCFMLFATQYELIGASPTILFDL